MVDNLSNCARCRDEAVTMGRYDKVIDVSRCSLPQRVQLLGERLKAETSLTSSWSAIALRPRTISATTARASPRGSEMMMTSLPAGDIERGVGSRGCSVMRAILVMVRPMLAWHCLRGDAECSSRAGFCCRNLDNLCLFLQIELRIGSSAIGSPQTDTLLKSCRRYAEALPIRPGRSDSNSWPDDHRATAPSGLDTRSPNRSSASCCREPST